jgi:hypothetical protein
MYGWNAQLDEVDIHQIDRGNFCKKNSYVNQL